MVTAEPEVERVLRRALEVTPDELATRAHVHGFHTYPARLHPVTARVLIEGLCAPGGSVLDPFCGSGTVLIEARLLGRRAVGSDANPLAARLAALKATGMQKAERRALVDAATHISAHADERRKTKAGPARKYGRADRDWFDIHVLLELDGLRDGIKRVPPGALRNALGLVLSSILVKVSRQPGDTSRARVPTRIAAGYPSRLFRKRAEELARQLAEYEALLPERAKSARVNEADARRLSQLKPSTIDLVVTSPPYPGVYDYLEHHSGRIRWLGLDARGFRDREMGSRRQLSRLSHDEARQLWQKDMTGTLRQMARVLRGGGNAALVLADAVLAGTPLYAHEVIERVAHDVDLSLVARASQERPHFHSSTEHAFNNRARREHLIVLRKSSRPKASGPGRASTPRNRGPKARGSSSRGRARGGSEK